MAIQCRQDLAALGKRLRDAGDRQLINELRRTIRAATEPTRDAIQQSALDTLPQSGGLNRWAAVKPTTAVNMTGKTSRVSVKAQVKGHDIAALNAGTARHPVFGNRKVWKANSVTPGFFDKPVEATSEKLRGDVLAAIEAVATKAIQA